MLLLQVVAEVDHYKEFVPWCVDSFVFEKVDGHAKASLKIGQYVYFLFFLYQLYETKTVLRLCLYNG